MEVVVFQEGAVNVLKNPMLQTLTEAPFAVTLCTGSDDLAQAFLAERTKPFTRAVADPQWLPDPLPVATTSVETNFVQVLAWRQDMSKRRMQAFVKASVDPQVRGMLFLLTARGLRVPQTWTSVFDWMLKQDRIMLFSDSAGNVHAVFAPAQHASWFWTQCVQRYHQFAQEMLDELAQMPLTMQVFQQRVMPQESGAVFAQMAQAFPRKVLTHVLQMTETDTAASLIQNLSSELGFSSFESSFASHEMVAFAASDGLQSLSSSVPSSSTSPTPGAWVFFGFIVAILVVGVGFASAQRGVRAKKVPWMI